MRIYDKQASAQGIEERRRVIIVTLEPVDAQTPAYDIQAEGGQRAEFTELLGRHKSCFPKKLPKKLPRQRGVDHNIEVQADSKPPSRPPYRLSQPELEELQRQLEDLLGHGFIEPCRSPYGAPVFFVKKTDGSLRLVCGWIPLNGITVKHQACLPNIDDLFDTTRGANYFSKLDLMSGYHQVRVRERDIPKTAINTPFGQISIQGYGIRPHQCAIHVYGADE